MQKMKICIKNINTITDDKYKEYYNLLNKEQRLKIDKLKFNKDKKLSLLGLIILKENFKFNINNIYYSNKKPLIYNKNFSISHKYPYTIVATSNKPIGIDIEKVSNLNNNIMKYLGKNSSIDTLIKWTKIESYYKCTNIFIIDDIENRTDVKFKTIILDKKYIISICETN